MLDEVLHDMGIDLYPDQTEIIWDRETKKFCVLCGRKAGKTQTVEIRQALRLLNDDVKGIGVRGGLCVSGDEQEGGEQILQGVANILDSFGWEAVMDRTKKSLEKQHYFMTRKEIQMPNGNRTLCITSKWGGRTMRKYSFHELDIDEADFISNEFYDAVRYCLARYNGVELLESTPNLLGDRKTHMAKAFFNVNPGYKIYHIPTTARPHIDPEWLTAEKKTKTPREWAREILAEYVSDISSAFPQYVIDPCITSDIEWRADAAFIGAKYARLDAEDNVIAENFHRDGVNYIRIGLIPQYGRFITEIENEIITIATHNGVERIVIDNSSLGESPIESMAKFVGDKVIGVQNHEKIEEVEGMRSKYMKEDLYINARKLMERGLVRFEDMRIKDAFMDVKYDYSKRSKTLFIIGNDITDAVVRCLFPVWGRYESLTKEAKKPIFMSF